MGTIICQDCQRVIEHFEDEKVSTLYGNCCSSCKSKNKHKA
ncbi:MULTISPECIES: GapA-binding peptide SR1P [Pontibacillus]|nr:MULTISPECIES: GapA-binding peptide SR1P [Pontibacillus]QHE52039.1 GapA-binding peptide SR1P [Pontibacillus sp. HMF3514]